MKRIWTAFLAVFFAAALLFSASIQASADSEQKKPEVSWRDYNGKRIGILTGPLMEDAAKEYFPDSEYLIFNTYPDCITALLSGKIDAYLGDEPGLRTFSSVIIIHRQMPWLLCVPAR